jgi:F0F1-type ATP synthase membrane subunit c/vacuolar-type H+-ATPase subunit K
MTRLRRGGTAAALAVAGLLAAAGPSYAADSFQDCINRAVDHNGEPPTCTKVNGSWVASWPDDSTAGFGGGFAFLVVLALVAAIGITVWKVSTAQKLAKQSGMDPGLATQMTLLTDDGLDATYLASSLRQQPPASPATNPTPTASTAERLEELKGLLDRGLVTQTEYDERRRAIIDSL